MLGSFWPLIRSANILTNHFVQTWHSKARKFIGNIFFSFYHFEIQVYFIKHSVCCKFPLSSLKYRWVFGSRKISGYFTNFWRVQHFPPSEERKSHFAKYKQTHINPKAKFTLKPRAHKPVVGRMRKMNFLSKGKTQFRAGWFVKDLF